MLGVGDLLPPLPEWRNECVIARLIAFSLSCFSIRLHTGGKISPALTFPSSQLHKLGLQGLDLTAQLLHVSGSLGQVATSFRISAAGKYPQKLWIRAA
jgi:hypothetical protein